MEFLQSLLLALILHRCVAIDIDDIFLSNCTNGVNCEDSINNNFGTSYSTEKIDDVNEDVVTDNILQITGENAINGNGTAVTRNTNDEESSTTRNSTTASSSSTTEASIDLNNAVDSGICSCDLTVSTCDTNCCCDPDCNDFQLSGFSNNSYHHRKIYDSRYCYTKNYIHRNNTQFILERLASNLFCIAYDNLPPIYGIYESLDLRDEKSFQAARAANNGKKYSWDWTKLNVPAVINISTNYHDPDYIWKLQNNKITLIVLPQSGFSSQCKFGKMLKYGESSKWKCMQTELSNDNEYLFVRAYENFTVVSPSRLWNVTSFITENHTCPDSVCLPMQTFYCIESICNETKSPEQSCLKGFCKNVIKRVRYKIALNAGTCGGGIESIQLRYELTNASRSFYQYFEVTFEKVDHRSGVKGFLPSEKSGYTLGNPITIGIPTRNEVNNLLTEYINVSNSIFHLTLPMRQSNGDCNSHERYNVGFGEDIRLKCNVQFTTDKFSSDSCVALQNKILTFFFNYLSHNEAVTEKFNIYVSKTREISEKLSTGNWTKILFDNVVQNVVTGLSSDKNIGCSGLLTSLNIDILYTIHPKIQDFDNYKIEGISVRFNEPVDISWLKCTQSKCNNILKIELLSLVSFTDISTKSMYYYASGPNLDISLPYDFFYPFMNNSSNAKPPHLIIHLIFVLFVVCNFCKLS